MKRYNISCMIGILCLLNVACTGFLDKKPDKKLATPDKLEDLEAILNNATLLNIRNFGLGEASADNFYLTTDIWNSLPEDQKEIYIWGEKVIPETNTLNNLWSNAYQVIFYCNSILEVLKEKFPNDGSVRVKQIKGKALFFRAFYYLSLTYTWAPAFDEADADLLNGVPLRLTSDFNITSKRASVRDCYGQIEKDLLQAIELLPQNVEVSFTPSLAAGYALLSRMYLTMRKYGQAEIFASKALAMNDELLDFSKLDTVARYPIPKSNKEILFNAYGNTIVYRIILNAILDEMYVKFDDHDLRKKHFFFRRPDGTIRFRGSYAVTSDIFAGLAVDEMYLNKAEVLVRKGNVSEGLSTLNKLLVTRWEKNGFVPFTADNKEDALRIILNERRKELIFRDLRWIDLKRLNKEQGFKTVLEREIGNVTYELRPGDDRYKMPLPENVINLTDMK